MKKTATALVVLAALGAACTGIDRDDEPTPSFGATTENERPAPERRPAPATSAPLPVEPPRSEEDPDAACPLVAGLTVEPEHPRGGYDRGAFGDYNRDALLGASLAEHGDYYSEWDDRHYADASDVDVDHTVALAEAWDSGASTWDASTLDAFGGDPRNLVLLTDEVNQGAKSDNDPTGWLPPVESKVDEYLVMYTDVKRAYALSIDPAERDAICATM